MTEYNKPLHIFNDYKGAASDVVVYKKNKAKLDILKPYFSAHLCNIWEHFFKYRNKPFGHINHVDKPSLGAFVGFGLMDEMFLNRDTYNDIESSKKELVLRQHSELFKALIDETDDGWDYNFDYGGGWYRGDNPMIGDSYPCSSKQSELSGKYYDLIIDEIGE